MTKKEEEAEKHAGELGQHACQCAERKDWLSWLVPAAGFNPVGLPVQGKPFGSIPKPVSSFLAVAGKVGCQLSFQSGRSGTAGMPAHRVGGLVSKGGVAVARGLGQQMGDKGQG